jgi:hypothetical protein
MDYDVEVISQALRKLKEETGGLIWASQKIGLKKFL